VKSRHPHESIESERKFQSSNLKRGASHAYQVGRPGRSERQVYYTENQNEMNAKLRKAITVGVSQSLVPKLNDVCGSVQGFGWPKIERVEVPITITSQHHHLGLQILDREAEWIKFNRNKIVTG
jgi:hypothetical protein